MPNIYPFKQFGQYQSFYPYYLPSYYGNYYPRSFEKYYYEPRMTVKATIGRPKKVHGSGLWYLLLIACLVYVIYRVGRK